MTTLSDSEQTFERWQAPFFEQPVNVVEADPAEVEKLAQARGFQVGKWEGLEAGRLEAEQMVERLKAVFEEMAQPFQGLDKLVAKELAQMAMLIAREVVKRELNTDSEVVLNIASEAVSTLSGLDGDIQIFLNPTDAALVKELLVESLEGKSWKLVEDPAMMPGGCRVKTPISYIDASVEKRMEAVFSSLVEASENNLD